MTTLQDVYNGLPDLRNGDADGFEVLHVATGLPAGYRFLPMGNFNIEHNDITYDIAVEAAMYASGLEGGEIDADKARKFGIVLAAARTGARDAWDLEAADLIEAQVYPEEFYTDRYAEVDNFDADLAVSLPHAATRAHYQAIRADADLLDEGTLAKLLKIGMASVSTCGVVLVKTDTLHHYVDPHKSVFRVVYAQIFGKGTPPPFGLTDEEFEDLVAHKCPHPIRTDRMVEWATDANTAVRLRAAGLGSAAVRIPALFPSESSSAAVEALMAKVNQVANSANVAVDMAAVSRLIAHVREPDMHTAAGRSTSADRMSDLIRTNGVDIARGIGIIREVCRNANIRPPPLLKSYALKKIAEDNPADVSDGATQMASFYRCQRERARRGILSGMALFGAAVPANTEALPADDTIAQILAAVVGSNTGNQVN